MPVPFPSDHDVNLRPPDSPEVELLARGIVSAINRLAAGLRAAGGTVVWCTHANVGFGKVGEIGFRGVAGVGGESFG